MHLFRPTILLCGLILGCGDGDDPRIPGDEGGVSRCDPLNDVSELRTIELPAPNAAGELDLGGWDLSCANLSWLDLRGANLRGANLHASSLLGTQLGEANLRGSNLTQAHLSACDLSGANLVGADLTGANVDGADLTWTKAFDLVGCPLTTGVELNGQGGGVAALPSKIAAMKCVPTGESFALVGAKLDLVGADLAGVGGESIVEARAYDLRGCPELVGGAAYACLRQPSSNGWAVVGPWMSVLDADFTGVDLEGVKMIGEALGRKGLSGGLLDCPALLSDGHRCAQLPEPGFVLLGPGVDLSGQRLQELDFLGADLSDADLTNTLLLFSKLADVRLGGATLAGASAFYLPECPAELPADWRCVEGAKHPDGGKFALVGPGAALGLCPAHEELNLTGADLAGVNLAGATLEFVNLSGASLSGADLSGTVLSAADLSNADLSDADLSDATLGPLSVEGELCSAQAFAADLSGAILSGVIWSNTTCPDGTNSDDHGETCEGSLEPAP